MCTIITFLNSNLNKKFVNVWRRKTSRVFKHKPSQFQHEIKRSIVEISLASPNGTRNEIIFAGPVLDGPETSSRKKDKGFVMMVKWSAERVLKRGEESHCCFRQKLIWLRTCEIARTEVSCKDKGKCEYAYVLSFYPEERRFKQGGPVAIIEMEDRKAHLSPRRARARDWRDPEIVWILNHVWHVRPARRLMALALLSLFLSRTKKGENTRAHGTNCTKI
jgi:hypothetical protein